jgi:hypothetical protein
LSMPNGHRPRSVALWRAHHTRYLRADPRPGTSHPRSSYPP